MSDPSLVAALQRTLAPLATGGLFSDFDGTLSPIVDDPATAGFVSGVAESLAGLNDRLGRLVLVSGRPLAFLATLAPPTIDLAGLYGAERRLGGVDSVDERMHQWRDAIASVLEAATHAPPGVHLEDKGLSLTLHYRETPDLADVAISWAVEQAERTGLQHRTARMSVELHPPVPVDKGTTIEELAVGLASVVYIGDDAGDLPAFDALDRLAGRGVSVLRVVARGEETPQEVVERADWVADGPTEVAAALANLLHQ